MAHNAPQVCLVPDLEVETIKIQITMKKEEKLNNAEHQALNIPVVMPNIVRKGFVQCMDGMTSWINTQSDEMIKVNFKDRETQLKYYCKYVKVTIEVIDESELD